MDYELMITEQAAKQFDNLLYYLLNRFGSQSAEHLLNGVDSIYNRLEHEPYQFPQCDDYFLNLMQENDDFIEMEVQVYDVSLYDIGR